MHRKHAGRQRKGLRRPIKEPFAKSKVVRPRRGQVFTKAEVGTVKPYTVPQSRGGTLYFKDSRGHYYLRTPDGRFEYVGHVKN